MVISCEKQTKNSDVMSNSNLNFAYKIFFNTMKDFDLGSEDKNKVYIFYSGGKDASILTDLFLKYKEEERNDLQITLLTVRFPEMIYNSADSQQRGLIKTAIKYWKKKELSTNGLNYQKE